MTNYLELVEAARLEAMGRLPDEPEDEDGKLIFDALVTDEAAVIMAEQMGDVIKACIHLINEMGQGQKYRYLPQEFESLREWAKFRFEEFIEESGYDWDYLGRFVTLVDEVLIHVDGMNVVDEVTGEVITPEAIIANATKTSMRGAAGLFQEGDDDDRKDLIKILASGGHEVEMTELRERIQKKKDPDGVRMVFYLEMDNDGLITIRGKIKQEELMYMEGFMSRRADFQWSTS